MEICNYANMQYLTPSRSSNSASVYQSNAWQISSHLIFLFPFISRALHTSGQQEQRGTSGSMAFSPKTPRYDSTFLYYPPTQSLICHLFTSYLIRPFNQKTITQFQLLQLLAYPFQQQALGSRCSGKFTKEMISSNKVM